MLEPIISEINSAFIKEAKNSPALLADMAAMEKYMSESYSGRIIVELLQNADDAHSSRVFITERDGNVIFANNGRPFTENDVMAISRSGASEKKRGVTIGYRGIGFKSTSFLSSEIIIHSNNTSFSFSKSKTAEVLGLNEASVPTIRIPFLVESSAYKPIIDDLMSNGFSTVFIFKSSDKEILREELESLTSDLMLFLKHLKEIETANLGEDKLLRVTRRNKDWGQEVSIGKEKWGIINNCVAFKIEDAIFIGCDAKDALYYTFLPTYDKTPFPFKLNGDFSTDPSRKHIRQDNVTQSTLSQLSRIIADIVEQALAFPRPLYSNLFSILEDNATLSPINSSFKKMLKDELNRRQFLRFNDGTSGKLTDYRCFPMGFEKSVVGILRKDSHKVWSKSLHPEVYECLNGVEDFLNSYSESTYSSQDITDLLEDESLVRKLPEYIYSYLLGKTVQAYNRSKLLSINDVNIHGILVKDHDENVIPLSQANMTSDEINELLLVNDSNQSQPTVSLKAFSQELGIEYVEKKAFNIFPNEDEKDKNRTLNEITEVSFEKPVFKVSKPVIPKWRSAENACVEIERFLGNTAHDVSIQNLGYDVDSTTPDGRKRYIEVKSVSRTDSSFSLTNNEYTAAHQYGDDYYICLVYQGNDKSKAIYIQNPVAKLKLEKRIRQWEWYCEEYQGEEIEIEY